jgi:hypothetical protein
MRRGGGLQVPSSVAGCPGSRSASAGPISGAAAGPAVISMYCDDLEEIEMFQGTAACHAGPRANPGSRPGRSQSPSGGAPSGAEGAPLNWWSPQAVVLVRSLSQGQKAVENDPVLIEWAFLA